MTARWRVGLATPAIAAVCSVALLAGCGGDDSNAPVPTAEAPSAASPAQGRSPISIEIADNSYTPSNLTVPKDTQVTWDWAGKNEHSIKGSWDGKSIESGQQRGGRWSFTFEKAGTFQYQCGVHGAGMAGKVTVKD